MTTFWLSDICSLLNSININPFKGNDKNFQFNSLTRLIILITLIGAILFQDSSNYILLAGSTSVFLVIVIYMLTYNSSEIYSGGKRENRYEFNSEGNTDEANTDEGNTMVKHSKDLRDGTQQNKMKCIGALPCDEKEKRILICAAKDKKNSTNSTGYGYVKNLHSLLH